MLDTTIDLTKTCSGPEAEEAVKYAITYFGPYFDDQAQRAMRRDFLRYTRVEVLEAIHQLSRSDPPVKYPKPEHFASVLAANHRFIRSQQTPKDEPEYASNPELEPDLRHQMIEACKSGDLDEIERLKALMDPAIEGAS